MAAWKLIVSLIRKIIIIPPAFMGVVYKKIITRTDYCLSFVRLIFYKLYAEQHLEWAKERVQGLKL